MKDGRDQGEQENSSETANAKVEVVVERRIDYGNDGNFARYIKKRVPEHLDASKDSSDGAVLVWAKCEVQVDSTEGTIALADEVHDRVTKKRKQLHDVLEAYEATVRSEYEAMSDAFGVGAL